MKKIVSIIRRSEQGITRPFQCRTEDGEAYWCKGLQQNIDGLRREWVCGMLANELKLPIREFEALDCPLELYEEWLRVSGEAGRAHDTFVTDKMHVVFGSKHVDQINDLRCVEQLIKLADKRILTRVLLFDKLIHNTDRTFRNSNILLPMKSASSFYLIDHGNAFNCEYARAEFLNDHIFSLAYAGMQKVEVESLFNDMVSVVTDELVSRIWHGMPDVWKETSPREYAISLQEMKIVIKKERVSL